MTFVEPQNGAVFGNSLLRGKVALVTGAFTGLGLHFARTLAASGAKVAMASRSIDRGLALAAEMRAARLDV